MPGPRKIPVGPLIATLGAVILIVSLFLDWYDGVTGWTIYEIVDLALTGLAVWVLYSMAAEMEVLERVADPRTTLAAAVVAFVIVVTQLINDPPAVAGRDGPGQDIGIWLALAGSALMVAGALVAATRISLAVEARGGDERTVPLDESEQPLRGPERP